MSNGFTKFIRDHILAIFTIITAVAIVLDIALFIKESPIFIDTLSERVMPIFTSILAIATIAYAIFAWELVIEARTNRQPKMAVYLKPREDWVNWVDVVIENIGTVPARNITFELENNSEYMGNSLSAFGFIKKGISHMAPQQKVQTFLTDAADKFAEKAKNPVRITVSYTDSNAENYRDIFTLDLSEFEGLLQVGELPINKISKNIEEIKNILAKKMEK